MKGLDWLIVYLLYKNKILLLKNYMNWLSVVSKGQKVDAV